MSPSVHIDKKKKSILILGKGVTQGLNHTLAAETHYFIKFTRSGIKFSLSLYYNGTNSFLFVNATKLYQFKANDYEINMKNTGLNGCAYDFSVYYRAFNTCNIINIHKYLMKKKWYKIMFGLIKHV